MSNHELTEEQNKTIIRKLKNWEAHSIFVDNEGKPVVVEIFLEPWRARSLNIWLQFQKCVYWWTTWYS